MFIESWQNDIKNMNTKDYNYQGGIKKGFDPFCFIIGWVDKICVLWLGGPDSFSVVWLGGVATIGVTWLGDVSWFRVAL